MTRIARSKAVAIASRAARMLRIDDPDDGLDSRGGDGLSLRLRGPFAIALCVIAVFFGAFGGWAAVARLDAGASARGTVATATARTSVEHLEGGVIAAVETVEGDTVEKGDVLLVLADARAEAGLDVYVERRRALTARIARLEAEWLGREAIAIPESLLREQDDARVAALLEDQRGLFEARRESLAGKTDVLASRIEQLRNEIEGLEAQAAAAQEQLRLIDSEISDVSGLVTKGLAPKTRLTALERDKAGTAGRLGDHRAAIARAEAAIGETRLQIIAARDERRAEVAAQTDEAKSELASILKQLTASEDVVGRMVVRAPIGGRVINAASISVGGVVEPGETIMEIVPDTDELVIEARISPFDIDVVRPGLKAKINLAAFSQRSLPQITGEVRQVSADVLEDPASGERYFAARVAVPASELEALAMRTGRRYELTPGMPADVLIVTGRRTVLGYLLAPFASSFRTSFREA